MKLKIKTQRKCTNLRWNLFFGRLRTVTRLEGVSQTQLMPVCAFTEGQINTRNYEDDDDSSSSSSKSNNTSKTNVDRLKVESMEI